MGKHIGEILNKRWALGVKHSLYHSEGTWYHQLTKFPGALCDPHGYVIFRTEAEFRNCSKLSIEKDVNLRYHISEIPGYVRVADELVYRDL